MEDNYYTNLTAFKALPCADSVLQFRTRKAYYFLSTLWADSATGPDGLATIFLRFIACSI